MSNLWTYGYSMYRNPPLPWQQVSPVLFVEDVISTTTEEGQKSTVIWLSSVPQKSPSDHNWKLLWTVVLTYDVDTVASLQTCILRLHYHDMKLMSPCWRDRAMAWHSTGHNNGSGRNLRGGGGGGGRTYINHVTNRFCRPAFFNRLPAFRTIRSILSNQSDPKYGK